MTDHPHPHINPGDDRARPAAPEPITFHAIRTLLAGHPDGLYEVDYDWTEDEQGVRFPCALIFRPTDNYTARLSVEDGYLTDEQAELLARSRDIAVYAAEQVQETVKAQDALAVQTERADLLLQELGDACTAAGVDIDSSYLLAERICALQDQLTRSEQQVAAYRFALTPTPELLRANEAELEHGPTRNPQESIALLLRSTATRAQTYLDLQANYAGTVTLNEYMAAEAPHWDGVDSVAFVRSQRDDLNRAAALNDAYASALRMVETQAASEHSPYDSEVTAAVTSAVRRITEDLAATTPAYTAPAAQRPLRLTAAIRRRHDAVRALEARTAILGAAMTLDDDVLRWATEMQRELDNNRRKGDAWEHCDPKELWKDATYHGAKLLAALRERDYLAIRELTADTANMFMMISDAAHYTPRNALRPLPTLQERAVTWVRLAFDSAPEDCPEERAHRFFEEAVELVQAAGVKKDDLLRLIEYTYSRKPGELFQEFGGTMLTLLPFAAAHHIDLMVAAETELARANTPAVLAKVRLKNARKDPGSPLPGLVD